MAIHPHFLFASASVYKEPQPWNRAFTISAGVHAALFLLFILTQTGRHSPAPTVLTEVKFVDRATFMAASNPKAPAGGAVAAPGKAPVAGERAPAGPVRSDPGVKSPETATGAYSDAGKSTSENAAPGAVGPMSGPIVALNDLGNIGVRKGALREASGRAGATGSGGRGLVLPDGTAGGKGITLNKEGLADIQKRETALGAPLLSAGMGRSADGRALALKPVGEKKKATFESLKSNPLEDDKWGKQKGPFSMEGPLKYRKIVRMELPPYPRWAEEKALEASVSIRLWVDPKGRVREDMYLERTSGFSELDHLAMDALRKFVFVAMPPEAAQEDEWGVATFRFELRK
jgi:TonB family protein